MTKRYGSRFVALAGAAVMLCCALSTTASAAATTTGSLRGALRTGRTRPSISLSLSSAVVLPHEKTELVATVQPHVHGRIVILKEKRHGRFVNLALGRTNRLGMLTFRRSFPTVGTLELEASVLADATGPAATSAPVTEQVDTLLPFVLPQGSELRMGTTSALVLSLQQRLSSLGYWVGTPDGYFGDATEQAVYALQKSAGQSPTGVVGQQFVAALNAGALPSPRTTSGNAIDVNLSDDLVMFVQNGALKYVINTSSGGGYTYVESGDSYVATTPTGVFSIYRTVDGTVTDPLGTLWRPRFFYEGFAIHGDSYVPPEPVSHGCVRISDEAIDWIWANNLAPIGMTVWVY